jgi:hypothetical protein
MRLNTPVSVEYPGASWRAGSGRCRVPFAVAGLVCAELAWGGRALAQTPPAREAVLLPRTTLPHALAALSVGRGLRFNNPFRLETPLGDDAESVSLAATYLDLSLGVLSLPVQGFQHGAALSAGFALQGIGQFVLTPSYLIQFGASPRLALRGRLGVPIVVAPDTTVGLEAGFGPSFPVAFGLGVTAELVGSVFFGAATEETSVTTVPLLSLQLGIYFDHEVEL